jgi:anti-sigma factor RsiW
MTCHEDVRISAWIDGELTSDEARIVETHVDGCASCRDLVSTFASMSGKLDVEVAPDPGFIVRFRQHRDALSVAPWWTWRQLALRLVPLAAATLVAAVIALWASPPSSTTLQALEREALGAPFAVDNGPESVLSIALNPFPQDLE